MTRHNLYVFRHDRHLTQAEIATKIGCSRNAYNAIESGKRNGNMKFWDGLKTAFNLSGNELMELTKCEDTQKSCS